MTEDDERDDFDLSAWEAPPPPVDLADGVVARAREGAPALEVAEPTRMASRARQRLIGGAAVVALAVAAVLMIWLAPGASHETAGLAADDGSSAGSDARKLVLPGAIATLDPGAQITWHRRGDDLVVSQRAGNATWQVDGGHRLVLDTGAVGASVEATGASLRVEVPMNLMDKRVLAGSAISAAVVAFATVTVYEGHVKTTTPTRTVIVEPGAEVALTDDGPAVTVKSSGGVTTPVAPEHIPSAGEIDGVLRTRAGEAKACAQQHPANGNVILQMTFGKPGQVDVSVDSSPDPELGACLAEVVRTISFPAAWHDMNVRYPFVFSDVTAHTVACDAKALAEEGRQKLGTNDDVGALKALAESLDCKDDASLYPSAYMAACQAQDEKAAKRYFNLLPSDRQASFAQICLRVGIDPRAAACDPNALADKGRQELGVGASSKALKDLEASLECSDDAKLYAAAYMAACSAGNHAKAKHWFKMLPPGRQRALMPICLRSGIDPR